ncbi:UNVERIFIED_CONTAM: Succinate--CoA ligase [ADP-forming] subunit beta, mitochondrial [Sesamum radiatum]|uniref:Succinate--CoA ligase [ADP-forming] subunit beta, mitochondrial n=1 Tax=Sesamum radiatum TaxID=300843 RepID=A0AAW2UP14_SESRA
MVRGLLGKLAGRSLSAAGKWQQQQLRRLNIHEYQGAELMSKHGINVPKGVAVGSVDEVRKVLQEVFPNQSEVVVKSQILAGGRGLGTFKSGLQGGVHIVKADQVEDIAGKMLGQILVTKQTGPQGKVVSKLIIACKKGGTSIEDLAESHPELIVKINPIAETSDKQLVAADAKLNFDDNAAFRQKEIFALRDPTQEDPREVVEAFKILTSDEKVKAILVNIFGGIMKCDVIASGIVNAAKQVQLKVPVVVRLEGTNVDQGKRILKESGMALITAEDLDDAAEKAVKALSS